MMLLRGGRPAGAVRALAARLAVDGFVILLPRPGTLRELRAPLRAPRLGRGHANFIDMHDLGDVLVHAGFADPVMDQEVLTLQWRDADALLAELRGSGGNAAPQRFPGCRTPRWREPCARIGRLAQRSRSHQPELRRVYGHAFQKPTQSARLAGDASAAERHARVDTESKSPNRCGRLLQWIKNIESMCFVKSL